MYLPQSQFIPNLHTNGNEYVVESTSQNYVGYYFQTYQGTLYSGKKPGDGNNVKLTLPPSDRVVRESDDPSKSNAITLMSIPDPSQPNTLTNITQYISTKPPKPRLIPQPNPTQPTPDDYVNGLFTRYFCKKNNELKYMEIDQPTYTKLKAKDASMAWDLYTPTSIQWYIAGEIEKVYNVNKSIVNLVEVEEKWYGFSQYFKQDYAKYFAV